MFDFLKPKKKVMPQILNEEDLKELKEIERKAYMEDAKKLIEARAKDKAKQDFAIKSKKSEWDLS